ncbi:MAG: hypothetical protein FJ316_08510 [SAR202 cluster bacterium]|nr:hypothetical protein [SAR202 cluster bacterium]
MRGRLKRSSKVLVLVSVLAVLALGIGGFLLRSLSQRIFGVTELVPPPAVSLKPEVLFPLGPAAVTNTLLSSWLVTLVLMGLFVLAVSPAGKFVRGLKTSVEFALESLHKLFTEVAGEGGSALTFSFVFALFLFIIANAWVTLLPVYGQVVLDPAGKGEAPVPLLRGAGTDINMSLALALAAGAYVEIHAFAAGGMAYATRFFPIRTFLQGRVRAGLGETYLATLHNITLAARVFSFTFRLFGALTAGELLLAVIPYLTPLVLVVPFYGLEVLLGLLQALVFAGLTLVFLVLSERHKAPSLETGALQ